MKPGWVAGSVRARLLANRRMGRDGCRRMAHAPPAAAVALLARSPYGRDVDPSMAPRLAARAAATTTLWHLRVLAGWLTAAGADTVRLLSGGFEIGNVEALLDRFAGGERRPAFQLGGLAVAWPRAEHASSAGRVREILASSPWGDPGASSAAAIGVGMRLAWARRVVDGVASAADWATAGAALVLAREALVFERALTPAARANAVRVLGRRWSEASWSTPDELAGVVPMAARSPLAGLGSADRLWEAEGRWRRQVERDALGRLRNAAGGAEVVAAAVAVLLVDLWRVQAALEACAWGERGLEMFDAVA